MIETEGHHEQQRINADHGKDPLLTYIVVCGPCNMPEHLEYEEYGFEKTEDNHHGFFQFKGSGFMLYEKQQQQTKKHDSREEEDRAQQVGHGAKMILLWPFWLLCFVVLISFSHVASAQAGSLAHYLQLGESNSPLLQDLYGQSQALALDSAKIKASYGPQVNGTGGFLYAPRSTNWGYDEAVTNGGLYSAVLGASLPLFTSRKKQDQLDAIGVQRATVDRSTAITQTELRRTITSLYITTYADQRALAIAQDRLQLLEKQERTINDLAQSGVYQQTDLLTFRVNAHAQSVVVQQAEALLRNDLHALGQLCGSTDTATKVLEDPALEIPPEFRSELSPMVEQFMLDSISIAIADIGVDAAYRPRLTAGVDMGLNAISLTTIPNSFGGSAGLNLVVPIYDGKQRQLEHQRVAIRERTRVAYRDRYVQQLDQRYGQLLEALDRSEALVDSQRSQSQEEERLIALYELELKHGLVRIADLFMVLNNHATTLSALNGSEADRYRIINELTHLK